MLTYTFALNRASWSSTPASNLLVIVIKLLHYNCNILNLDISLFTSVLKNVTWIINDGHDVSSDIGLRLGLRKEWDKWLVILSIKDRILLSTFLVAWPYVNLSCFKIWSLCNITLFTPSSFAMLILNSKVSTNFFLKLSSWKSMLGNWVGVS
jgi:hypothetical protein